MTNFYYYNENGDKISVTGEHLKRLAENGHITPNTIIEDQAGKQAPAGKVKGLTFAETVPDWIYEPALPIASKSSVPAPPVEANPFTAPVPVERNPFTAAVPPPVKADSFTTEEIRQALREADRRANEHQALVRQALLNENSHESGQQKNDTTEQKRFCTNCGNPVSFGAGVCPSCGAAPNSHKKFCRRCATALTPEQIACVKCKTVIAGEIEWAPFWCAIGILVGLVFIFGGVVIPGIVILIISVINFIVSLVKMAKR